ncbi:hypothetical protein OBBRIDRAFT_823982 [Obba rivulosa]|uniref:C2H2-type domain-containing protein n=1 Tax=Obba rivulosa TaxID=1052685 RepID=A0A8E2DPU2_9APHY|nr:hypothetical protein OBBRIDRAFT_823982 [Obba rivulosa]
MVDEREKVTLPSINEMFPEHLLAGLPPKEHRETRIQSSYTEYTPSALASHQLSARYSPTFQERRHDPDTIMYDGTPPPSDRMTIEAATSYSRSSAAYTSRNSNQLRYSVSPRINHANQVAASNPLHFSRPQPLTARLENIASRSDVSVATRVPNMSNMSYTEASIADPPLNAITKARPAFRVQLPLPPRVPGTRPSDASNRSMSADQYDDRPSVPPSYSANVYLSTPASNTDVHALQRVESGEQAENPSDEKRHRCPHCSKRFNRPSSLNIHVNTHTGAKPFMCRFPGCNRQFNVNSNMRRHYRNHLTARRRDVVARFLQPASPAASSPPPAVHPLDVATTRGAAAPLHNSFPNSLGPRSPSSGQPGVLPPASFSPSDASPGSSSETLRGSTDMSERGSPVSPMGACRLRSQSGRSPHYRAELYEPGSVGDPGAARGRSDSQSCSVPGCGCSRISPTLRPAFPESMPTATHGSARPGS